MPADFQRASKILPFLRWLPGYSFTDLRGDALAGVTISVMLIPQSMAYALLAGLPPISGLYAGIIGVLAYALFATSRHLSVGPVALESLLVLAGLSVIAAPGTDQYVALAALLAVLVGATQFLMGIFRLGFLVNVLARPVVGGFVSAAPIIIGLSQFQHILAVQLPSTQQVPVILADLVRSIPLVHLPTLLVGSAAILLLLAAKSIHRLFPRALLAVSLGIVAVMVFDLGDAGIALVGAVPRGIPTPALPTPNLPELQALVPTALTLALVGFAQSHSIARVYADRYHYPLSINRELMALGWANFFVGLFRGYPVSGSYVRTAMGDQSGIRTPLAGIAAAFVIAITLLFLTPYIQFIPRAILAAVVIVAVIDLVDTEELRFLLTVKRTDGLLFLFTFLSTLVFGILHGIVLGVLASLLPVLFRFARPRVVTLGRLPGTTMYRSVVRNPGAEVPPGIVILRIDASFAFLNAAYLKNVISRKAERDIRAVVIDAGGINDLDTTALGVLQEIARSLQKRNVDFYLAGAKGPVLDPVIRSGFYDELGSDHFPPTVQDAVAAVDATASTD